MARKARFLRALPVYVTPEVRDRVEAIADREEVSIAQIIREIIDAGLNERERYGRSDRERPRSED